MEPINYVGWAKKQGQSSYLYHMHVEDVAGQMRPLCDPKYPTVPTEDRFRYLHLTPYMDYKSCSKCHDKLPSSIRNNLYGVR